MIQVLRYVCLRRFVVSLTRIFMINMSPSCWISVLHSENESVTVRRNVGYSALVLTTKRTRRLPEPHLECILFPLSSVCSGEMRQIRNVA